MSKGRFGMNLGENQEMKLHQGILIYSGGKHAFATEHKTMLGKDGAPILDTGKPLTDVTMAKLVKSFANNVMVGSFIAENVLSIGMDSLVWWVKPTKRTIHFDCDKEKGIGKESALIAQPGLVFAVSQGDWYVFAVKGNKRPSQGTKLHCVPHFNVWEGGKVCTGNVTLPKDYSTASMGLWEEAYFGSNFTHPNMTELVKFKGGSYSFWRSMLDGNYDRFPTEVLIPTEQTVGDFINEINGVA